MPTPRHKTERTNHNGFDNTKNGFRIPCKWNLDPRFQTLAGFRILWNEFQIPKPRISNSDSKNSRILKFRLPYMGPVNDFIGFCFKGLEYNEIYRINMLYFRDVHVLLRCGQMSSTLFFSVIRRKAEIDEPTFVKSNSSRKRASLETQRLRGWEMQQADQETQISSPHSETLSFNCVILI